MSGTDWGEIESWLRVAWEAGGTDLLLTAGSPPRMRVDGALRAIAGEPVLDSERIDKVVHSLLSPDLLAIFESHKDVDFAFSLHEVARVRGNAFMQKGSVTLALRIIPSRIPTFEEIGLPPVGAWLAGLPRGLRDKSCRPRQKSGGFLLQSRAGLAILWPYPPEQTRDRRTRIDRQARGALRWPLARGVLVKRAPTRANRSASVRNSAG